VDISLLKEVGLTDGEVKVYSALIKIGKSSTGPIIDNSSVSGSKVYGILEKLIKKGFVSYVTEEGIKQFQPTNPQSIVEYVETKKKELNEKEKAVKKLSLEIENVLGSYEEETAQIYKGYKGIKVAFEKIFEEVKGKSYSFFSLDDNEFGEGSVRFFQQISVKRGEMGVTAKGIANLRTKKQFLKIMGHIPSYDVRFSKLNLPSSVTFTKKRVLITLWEGSPIGFEIVSERVAKKYQELFDEIWNQSPK
jgi:HTH-type transcriptional regulator, sugar sensing transcriptional regulator